MIDSAQAPSDSSRRQPSPAGRSSSCSSAAWVFGGTAPLNGAVIANGVVKVDGNRKSVHTSTAASSRKLRVKEGDRIEAGDIVIALDDTQAKASRWTSWPSRINAALHKAARLRP
jgi:hypothetical protein